jgi:hypothetical protein
MYIEGFLDFLLRVLICLPEFTLSVFLPVYYIRVYVQGMNPNVWIIVGAWVLWFPSVWAVYSRLGLMTSVVAMSIGILLTVFILFPQVIRIRMGLQEPGLRDEDN